MSHENDPARLLDGGLVDGEAPSPDMLELLGALRGATIIPSEHVRAGARAGGSWGRWLIVVGAMIALSTGGSVEARPVSTQPAPMQPASTQPASIQPASTQPISTPTDEPALAAVPEPSRLEAPLDAAPAARVDPPSTPRRARRAQRVAPTEPPVQLASLITVPLPIEPSTAPVPDATPSEAYASALAAYARGDCERALPDLQRVVEGSTGDAPLAARRAELVLATCLARLGWHHSAVQLLDGIAQQGPSHPYFGESLGQLARLAPRLPDPSVLVPSFANDDEARLADEDLQAAADAAAYLQGRARYEAGEREIAVRLFARVSAGSSFHRAARFYEGISEVRLRHAQRAAAAFRAVIDSSEEGDRYRDLATLALARLYYAVAQSEHAAGDETRANELLAQAIEAWRRVPLSSEQFLDAFFEESWAIYLAGEDERALGHVFGLLSPFFEDHEHPEAYVVRGTIHFEHCLFDYVDEDVRDFHSRYDTSLGALATLVGVLDDDQALALYESRASSLDPVTRRLVTGSILDRDSARRAQHVRSVEAELARLPSASFAGSTLEQRLAVELSLARAFARTRLAEGVREHVAAAHEALVARANEIDTVALEVATARREMLSAPPRISEGTQRERQIIADQGFEIWPFDGEYWEDEVTSYREVLHDQCAR